MQLRPSTKTPTEGSGKNVAVRLAQVAQGFLETAFQGAAHVRVARELVEVRADFAECGEDPRNRLRVG